MQEETKVSDSNEKLPARVVDAAIRRHPYAFEAGRRGWEPDEYTFAHPQKRLAYETGRADPSYQPKGDPVDGVFAN